jgi:4-amino-4-deoxy-L-arabinose transferase-like glycosyltransferase
VTTLPVTLWGRLLVLAGAALLLRLAVLQGVLLDPAIGLQVDEAQYWGWSRDLQWGYYSKPPAIAALIAASTALFGDSVTGVKALAMALHAATALALAALAHTMAGAAQPPARAPVNTQRAACWAAAITLSNPVASWLGLAVTTDAPLLLCWTLAAAALWRLHQRDRLRDWAWLGLWLGLGLLSKYTMAVLLIAVAGVMSTRPAPARHPISGPALMLTVLALLLAPHLAWNAAAGWPTWHHTADITVQAQRVANTTWLASLGEWLGGQWLLFGPLWLPLIAWHGGPWSWSRRHAWRPTPAQRFLLWLALPLLLIGTAQAIRSGAQLNWTAPAGQALVLALALWLSAPTRHNARRAATAVVLLHLLVLTALPLVGTATRALAGPEALPPRTLDLWARMRGWEDNFAALATPARSQFDAQPQTLLIGTHRTVIAHGQYAWRDLGWRWHAWRPDTALRPIDHYQLTAGWPADRAADPTVPLLIVGEGDTLPAEWIPRLAPPERLADARHLQARGREQHLVLWRTRLRPPGQYPDADADPDPAPPR